MIENGRMGRDTKVAHDGRPAETKQIVLLHAGIEKRSRAFMRGTIGIGGIKQDIDIQSETHKGFTPFLKESFSSIAA